MTRNGGLEATHSRASELRLLAWRRHSAWRLRPSGRNSGRESLVRIELHIFSDPRPPIIAIDRERNTMRNPRRRDRRQETDQNPAARSRKATPENGQRPRERPPLKAAWRADEKAAHFRSAPQATLRTSCPHLGALRAVCGAPHLPPSAREAGLLFLHRVRCRSRPRSRHRHRPYGSRLAALSLFEEIENLAFVINRAPKPELFAGNDHGHLIEMPAQGWTRASGAQVLARTAAQTSRPIVAPSRRRHPARAQPAYRPPALHRHRGRPMPRNVSRMTSPRIEQSRTRRCSATGLMVDAASLRRSFSPKRRRVLVRQKIDRFMSTSRSPLATRDRRPRDPREPRRPCCTRARGNGGTP